jgi:hypothetical protein
MFAPKNSFLTAALAATSVNASYLVVAGGGGGGVNGAGGGGAGGMLTGSEQLDIATVYTITIGGGGNGSTSYAVNG